MNENTKLLLNFCKSDDEEKILEILKQEDIDINAYDENHMTCLHYAALHNNIKVIQQLLNIGCINVNSQNSQGNTPLHLAAQHKNALLIDMLLNASSIDLTLVNNNHCSILDVSLHNDNAYLVYQLYRRLNLDLRTIPPFQNPVTLAATAGYVESLKILLNIEDIYIDIKENDYRLLYETAHNVHYDCLRLLFEYIVKKELDVPHLGILKYLLNNNNNNNYAEYIIK